MAYFTNFVNGNDEALKISIFLDSYIEKGFNLQLIYDFNAYKAYMIK